MKTTAERYINKQQEIFNIIAAIKANVECHEEMFEDDPQYASEYLNDLEILAEALDKVNRHFVGDTAGSPDWMPEFDTVAHGNG